MNHFSESGRAFNSSRYVVEPPATELLLSPEKASVRWPVFREIGHSAVAQIEQRNVRVSTIIDLMDRLPIPTITVESAYETGIVDTDQLCASYEALSEVLADPEYARLVLYLPFELLPPASWRPQDMRLTEPLEHFSSAYRHSWFSLLGVHDVRANFVDGDVLESEFRDGDLNRVVKAAHLIPILLEKGLLQNSEVRDIYSGTSDPLLRRSIAEGLLAHYGVSATKPSGLSEDHSIPPGQDHVSERRQQWLDARHEEGEIQSRAEEIAGRILDDARGIVLSLPKSTDSDQIMSRHASIEGIYIALAQLSLVDPDRSRAVFNECRGVLQSYLHSDDTRVRARAQSTYRRLRYLGVIDMEVMRESGVRIPRLDGPFSENLDSLEHELSDLRAILDRLQSSPDLRGVIYPLIALGGSRLKGYGDEASDVDVSIFLRPEMQYSDCPRIRALLQEAFTVNGVTYDPIQFWLEELDRGELGVHDFDDSGVHTGGSDWTHILFGNVWVGDDEAVRELQRRLLGHYFWRPDDTSQAEIRRERHLERIEQDVLQYRLMHKGYERHYPRYGSVQLGVNDAVDGSSVYWESGYRHLATRLFLRNVFLPRF